MRILSLIILFGTVVHLAKGQNLDVSSPNGEVNASFFLNKRKPFYRVMRQGREIIGPSRLGFILKDAPPLVEGFEIESQETKSVDETWTQPWGEKKDIRNHYNELRINLVETSEPSRRMTIVFRVFTSYIWCLFTNEGVMNYLP